MQKCFLTLALSAFLTFVGSAEAAAVEFKTSGEWLWAWGGVESTLVKDSNGNKDVFDARQRLRLQLEAIVSDSLSGTLRLQIGDIAWGKAEDGGALGTDGTIVRVRDAYLDWKIPHTELSLRMGLQGLALPNAAGGSSILDEQVAGIVSNYTFNDTVGLTAFWVRPFNDNYTGFSGPARSGSNAQGFLDNADYVGLSLPLKFEGVEVTPWAMLGFVGRNALDASTKDGESVDGPSLYHTMPLPFSQGTVQDGSFRAKNHAYASQFYAGLPIVVAAFDPFNIELDINYGYAAGFGNYSLTDRLGTTRRADSMRQGGLIKALVEYKLDWGTPSILGWYASGDDGNVKNGSERMPSIAPSSNFTSFMQDGPNGWSLDGGYDKMLTYAGTWGVGLQLRDLSCIEDLRHTLRVVYWGGTNAASMIRQTSNPQAWNNESGLYLTTLDHLVEINVDNNYRIYENLEAVVELGYIINGMDRDAWRKHSAEKSYQNADAWKAALLLKYTF
ncbi:MAG: outer membrane homotrimeric porin [Desulfovibrionaceae bacterium]